MAGSITADAARARARVASLSRSRSHDDPDLVQARSDLTAATLEARVRKLVDAAPPLTPTQRARLSAILDGNAGAS